MKTCEDVQRSLGAWHDRELNLSDSTFISDHIKSCGGCAREHAQLLNLESALTSFFQHQTAPVTTEKFWHQLEAQLVRRPSLWERASRFVASVMVPARVAWTVPVVIGIFLVAVSGLNLLERNAPTAGRNNFAVVDSIDAFGRSVALWREDETKTTVIWLYQPDEGDKEVVEQPAQASPTF